MSDTEGPTLLSSKNRLGIERTDLKWMEILKVEKITSPLSLLINSSTPAEM